MTSRLNPYANFRGRAREALTFWHSVFGGELQIMSFADGGMEVAEGERDQVMHGQLDTPVLTLMAADAPAHMELPNASFMSISLSGDDEAELTGWFEALAEGGTVTVPLNKAPWGDTFGMLVDRFGVQWLTNIAGPTA
jgi:PhnB protein